MIKTVCIWLVGLLTMAAALRFTYQIWRREITPMLSSWLVFFLSSGLSLATYAVAKEYDFVSGVLNTADVVGIALVVCAILVWGNRRMRFTPFEKKYLWGIGIILVYGFSSGDAWSSNIFMQILMTTGYIPTIQNITYQKRNTESFTGWGCDALASLVALYPAFTDGNELAALYTLRAFVCIAILLTLMIYYQLTATP